MYKNVCRFRLHSAPACAPLNMTWCVFRLSAFSKSVFLKCSGGFSRKFVTAQEIRTFQERGVVCLRGVFGEWVEKLKKGIATNHASPSEFSEWLKSEDSQTFYFNDYFNWRKIPEFEEFVLASPAAEVAGKLMKSEVTTTFIYIDIYMPRLIIIAGLKPELLNNRNLNLCIYC